MGFRVPLSKIYRAFPELDDFPDAECERFVRAARTQQGGFIDGASFGAFVVVLAASITLMILARDWFVAALAAAFGRSLSRDDIETFGLGLGMATIALLAWIAFAVVRDHFLRRAVSDRLILARCTACRFSLLGLPCVAGVVRCPECGVLITLAAIGLKESDLLVRPPTHTTAAPPTPPASPPASPTASPPSDTA